MKKFSKIFCLLISILLIFGITGCKKAAEEINTPSLQKAVFTLTVLVSEGITGDPAPGTYTFNVGDTVSYSFTQKPGFLRVNVTLDGEMLPSNGTLIMSADKVLSASTGLIDIRWKWKGLLKWPEPESDFYQKEWVYFMAEFTGGIQSGFTRGLFDFKQSYWGRGPFTIEGENITFKL